MEALAVLNSGEAFELLLSDRVRRDRDLQSEIEHRLLPWRDIGLAIIDRHLVRDERILRSYAQNGAVRDHAVVALIGAAGGDHDHFTLGLGQPASFLHQRVVISEEGAEFIRTMRHREEHVRNESGLCLHLLDPGSDIVGHFLQ